MEQKLQIYVAGALTTASQKELAIYETIDKVCVEAGFAAYLPHRDTGPRHVYLAPPEVFLKNTDALQNSIAVIAEVSTPSIGVGMECEYALRYRLPLIAVARTGVEVSRMLLGHPAVRHFLRYDSEDNLRGKLLDEIRKILSKPLDRPGLFVVFEGMDGTGKSSLAQECAHLYRERFPGLPVLLVSDPPSLKPWDQIMSEIKKNTMINAQSEAILLLAARVDQVNRSVLPALRKNGIVFADRFHDTWLVYQAERLGRIAEQGNVDYFLNLATIIARSLGGLIVPDHTFVFTGDPISLYERLLRARGHIDERYENPEMATKVRDRYVWLYERDSERMTLLDTTRRSLEDLKTMVVDYIDNHLLTNRGH